MSQNNDFLQQVQELSNRARDLEERWVGTISADILAFQRESLSEALEEDDLEYVADLFDNLTKTCDRSEQLLWILDE